MFQLMEPETTHLLGKTKKRVHACVRRLRDAEDFSCLFRIYRLPKSDKIRDHRVTVTKKKERKCIQVQCLTFSSSVSGAGEKSSYVFTGNTTNKSCQTPNNNDNLVLIGG